MNKTPRTIDNYNASFPPPTQKILRKVRQTIRAIIPEAQEVIKYGAVSTSCPSTLTVNFYVSTFKNSKTHSLARMQGEAGALLRASFELNGQAITPNPQSNILPTELLVSFSRGIAEGELLYGRIIA